MEPKFRGQSLPAASTPSNAGAIAHAAGGNSGSSGAAATFSGATSLSVEENEKRLLREALLKARGNRTKAAELMGVSRRTLHRKIAQWPELDVTDK